MNGKGINRAFHVAVLVRDLEQAIADFEKALNLTFTTPMTTMVQYHGGMDGAFPNRSVLSKEGPVHIELLEGVDDPGAGLYSLEHGEGLHHIGFWGDTLASFEASSCIPIWTSVSAGDGVPVPLWFTSPTDLHGVRLEFHNEALIRPMMESLLGDPEPAQRLIEGSR